MVSSLVFLPSTSPTMIHPEASTNAEYSSDRRSRPSTRIESFSATLLLPSPQPGCSHAWTREDISPACLFVENLVRWLFPSRRPALALRMASLARRAKLLPHSLLSAQAVHLKPVFCPKYLCLCHHPATTDAPVSRHTVVSKC